MHAGKQEARIVTSTQAAYCNWGLVQKHATRLFYNYEHFTNYFIFLLNHL